jgi:hypothetical protein
MAGDGNIEHYSFPREWEEVMFYACHKHAHDVRDVTKELNILFS